LIITVHYKSPATRSKVGGKITQVMHS